MERPPFDEKIAAQFVGKSVLIGITYRSHNGAVARQEQMFGRIVAVHSEFGIQVQLSSAELRWFPPNIQSLTFAQPGDYTLRSTGEVITDPDLLWTWIVTENSQT